MNQVTSLRKRHRLSSRMIRTMLLIGFLFFFGRPAYSAIGAWCHHQDKKEPQQTIQPQQTSSAQINVH